MSSSQFKEDALREALGRLSAPARLDHHPWAAPLGAAYLQAHPERDGLSPGEALGWALADLWRKRFRPGRMAPEYKADWQAYLILEALYFFPFRTGHPPPKTLNHLGSDLSNRETLALVVAEGDEARAEAYGASEHAAFWEAIIPDSARGVEPESTLRSRRDVALRRLAEELNARWRTPAAAVGAAPQTAPSAPAPDSSKAANPIDHQTEAHAARCLPPKPGFVPPEWTPLFERAHAAQRLCITAPVGAGKTYFMAALAHWLRERGESVLLLSLADYDRVAPDKSPYRYAVENGPHGQAVKDEGLRRSLEDELEMADRDGRLWVLADETGGLTTAARDRMAEPLSRFRHLVVTERDRHPGDCFGAGESVALPALSPLSLNTFIAFVVLGPGKRLPPLAALWPGMEAAASPPPLAWLGLAAQAWTHDSAAYHPAAVTAQWVRRLLRRARSSADGPPSIGDESGHAFLEELAACRVGLWDVGRPGRVGREAAGRAARQVGAGEQAAAMLDHACRAGILEAVGRGEWTFTHGVFELYFAAEYAGRHASAWAVLCPKYRTLLNWAARLLARRGDETATGAFLNGMAGLQEDRLGLRWLALADLIAEHDAYRSATAQNLCARIEAGLRELARIDSGRLRDAIRRLAVPLGWDDIVLEDEVRVEAFEPDPAPLRTNLRALLALLGRSDLEGDGEAALRDRRVLGALIDAGLRHPEPDAAMRSAAWLHAAPLGEVLVARIFPPSLRLAVEAVADAAVDRALPEASRRAAWSALRRVDLLPVLAAFGETYLPQVHTLRLELGVGLVQARDEEWVVLGGADEG